MLKMGSLASFLLAPAFIVAPLIYLVGDLRSALGPFAYALADFLSGPLWAAGLVIGIVALREYMAGGAQRRLSLALSTAVLAAGLMVLVACIRAANRQYHLLHPELHLESAADVLVVWTTILAGVTGAGWHFLGWTLVLVGSAGYSSNRLPRGLSILYWVAGITSLCVYQFPNLEGAAVALGVIWAIWQAIFLWKATPPEAPAPQNST